MTDRVRMGWIVAHALCVTNLTLRPMQVKYDVPIMFDPETTAGGW